MKINQAFNILSRAGGVRAARIITESMKKPTWFRMMRAAAALRRGVPVAKIVHNKWFYGLPFYTNRHTLDPRPDTETLVAAVIADCDKNAPNILDLGTGTGCIIASIVKNVHGARGVGLDISRGARRVARRNVRALGLTAQIKIMRGSFGRKIKIPGAPFDVIVSNPPYIARGDMRVNHAATFDPGVALYAADNGLAAYRQIASTAANWAHDKTRLYLEIGIDQGANVKKIFTDAGWEFVRAESDLGGIERVLVFRRARN